MVPHCLVHRLEAIVLTCSLHPPSVVAPSVFDNQERTQLAADCSFVCVHLHLFSFTGVQAFVHVPGCHTN